jgi:hypothetical protein
VADNDPMIPQFQADGLLPPADYEVSLAQLRRSVLVLGPDSKSEHWDTDWRSGLVDRLEVMVWQLWQVGVRDIFVNGSFVEDKDHPNDIDGYFNCDQNALTSGQLQQDLNLLEIDKIWTWSPHSRRPHLGYPKAQLPMWHKYRVELYPHVPGLLSGICDKHGHELEFPAAFRQCRRNGATKGIVKIRYEDKLRS